MNVIIVGCGRLGATLAYQLYRKKHRVTVIDLAAGAFGNLPPDFHGRTMEGEVLNQDMLHRAGIEQAEAFIAVTSSDSLNAVACHVARSIYKVPTVIARNYDPRWLALLEIFGLQTVSSALWATQHIEEMIEQTWTPVLSAGHGEVEVYEIGIPDSWGGKTVGMVLPPGSTPVAVTRTGKAILATADTLLEQHDVIHVGATLEGITALQSRINEGQEE